MHWSHSAFCCLVLFSVFIPGTLRLYHLDVSEMLPTDKGPSLRQHYPASTVILPSPTSGPAITLQMTLEVRPPPAPDLPQLPRSPSLHAVPSTPADRIGACRFLPYSHGLPRLTGGSASTTSLSRPAQASLALRPAGSQLAQRRTSVPRLRPGQLPDPAARSRCVKGSPSARLSSDAVCITPPPAVPPGH
jgi:hypothetical protein